MAVISSISSAVCVELVLPMSLHFYQFRSQSAIFLPKAFTAFFVLPAFTYFFQVSRKTHSPIYRLKNYLMETIYIFQQMGIFVYDMHKYAIQCSKRFSFPLFLKSVVHLGIVA